MSDGEHDEGNTWEAVLLAAKYKLDNIICIMDRNNIQIDGHTENVMPLGSLAAKLSAFNFNVIEVDGHNMANITEALERAKVTFEKPTAIILTTTPGKGVSFMENNPAWHGKVPSRAEEILALAELKKPIKRPHMEVPTST